MQDHEQVRFGRRLIRGFRRIGIVAAAPCFAAAIVMAGYGVVSDYQNAHRDDWWKNAPLAKPATKSGALTFDEFMPVKPGEPAKPTSGPWDAYRTPEPRLVPVDHDPFAKSELWSSLAWAGGIAAIGVLLFLTFFAIGWICAGFARDQP